MIPVFRGQVKNGQISLYRKEDFACHVARLSGKEIELVVRPHKSKRSDEQNKYYWGVVVALLAEHCGYEPEEMHEALKYRFLRQSDGEYEDLPRIRSSAILNTKDFAEYVDKCRMLGAELGVVIPGPNNVDF